MKTSIVFESNAGHTAKLAEAVAGGARSVPGAEVALIRIGDDGIAPIGDLIASDAIIFGSPTFNVSGLWVARSA